MVYIIKILFKEMKIKLKYYDSWGELKECII